MLDRIANDFGASLPHTKPPYSSRAWGHGYHSLCSYQGKLKPSLAHWLVRSFTNAGDRVLDPLGGVGTIALEAALMGRLSFTSDLSPFASTVARAKVAPPSADKLMEDFIKFEHELKRTKLLKEDRVAAEFGLNAKVEDYYESETLEEVLKARKLFRGNDLTVERNFLKACTLHILHGNRPYALSRVSHPITPFNPSGPFEYRSLIDRLSKRLHRLLALEWPETFTAGVSWHSDFRNLPTLLTKPTNAIICSPPFPGMRFDRPNWLRLWFCGWSLEDFHETSKGFLERQQGRGFEIYRDFFAVCAETTTRNSPVVLHVGGSKSYDMATRLQEIGSRFLKFRTMVTENVEHVEKHGIKDKGTTSSHIFLVFERI